MDKQQDYSDWYVDFSEHYGKWVVTSPSKEKNASGILKDNPTHYKSLSRREAQSWLDDVLVNGIPVKVTTPSINECEEEDDSYLNEDKKLAFKKRMCPWSGEMFTPDSDRQVFSSKNNRCAFNAQIAKDKVSIKNIAKGKSKDRDRVGVDPEGNILKYESCGCIYNRCVRHVERKLDESKCGKSLKEIQDSLMEDEPTVNEDVDLIILENKSLEPLGIGGVSFLSNVEPNADVEEDGESKPSAIYKELTRLVNWIKKKEIVGYRLKPSDIILFAIEDEIMQELNKWSDKYKTDVNDMTMGDVALFSINLKKQKTE